MLRAGGMSNAFGPTHFSTDAHRSAAAFWSSSGGRYYDASMTCGYSQFLPPYVQQTAEGAPRVFTNIMDVQRGATETGSASLPSLSGAQSLSNESRRVEDEVSRFLKAVRWPNQRRMGELKFTEGWMNAGFKLERALADAFNTNKFA